MLLWRDFPDDRAGPRFFVQAGSGQNWKDKVKSPDLALWEKLVDFTVKPTRALAIPFALDSREFAVRTNSVEGLLFDRHRILAQDVHEGLWVPDDLRERLIAWLEPRVAWLQQGALRLVEV